MKLPVYNPQGKPLDSWNLDEKALGSVNETLLAQAIRVYNFNSHQKTSKVKTRGEVEGSTKKIYRQKGTGNARHGARYAPIFVGGGIAHGPKGVRPHNLILPKKMRARALSSSLLLKLQSSMVSGLGELQSLKGKTSEVAQLLAAIADHPKRKVLVVTGTKVDSLYRGVKNLQDVMLKQADLVNALDLVYFDHLVITKDALDSLIDRASMKKAAKPVVAVPAVAPAKKASPAPKKTVTPAVKPPKTVQPPAKTRTVKKVTKKESQ